MLTTLHRLSQGFLVLVLGAVLFLRGCGSLQTAPGSPGDTDGTEGAVVERPDCPQATPELLQVEPVTSPTDLLAQAITVRMGNCEAVTITAESGTFTGDCQREGVSLRIGGKSVV